MSDSIWPRYAELKTLLPEVIGRWHAAESEVESWADAEAAIPLTRPAGWLRTTEKLQLINTFQWHEEDRSRAHGAGDEVLAAVKRSIDDSNRRRVQTVDRLDDEIFTRLKQAGALAAGAPLNSESPGSIIDRLTVLALKVYHIEEAIAQLSPGPEMDSMREKLATLTEQSADLGGCLDALMDGIRAGRIGLKLYRQVKVYVEPGSGKLKEGLE